jgi:hypothetical protein
VHFSLAGSGWPASSPGNHCPPPAPPCAADWDGVHTTPGSALNEGWATFWAQVVAASWTAQFNDPDSFSPDGTAPCWGPHRECAVASALWRQYVELGSTPPALGQLLAVLGANPADVHGVHATWVADGRPSLAAFEGHLRDLHIPPRGDGWAATVEAGDGCDTATGPAPGSTGTREGVLSFDTHQLVVDRSDWYTFRIDPGDTVQFDLTVHGTNLDLEAYGPDTACGPTPDAASSNPGSAPESVTVTAGPSSLTDPWRVRVVSSEADQGQGRYELRLTVVAASPLPGCGDLQPLGLGGVCQAPGLP